MEYTAIVDGSEIFIYFSVIADDDLHPLQIMYILFKVPV